MPHDVHMTEESFGTAGDRPGCGCLSLVLVVTFAAAAAVIWAVNDAAPARDREVH